MATRSRHIACFCRLALAPLFCLAFAAPSVHAKPAADEQATDGNDIPQVENAKYRFIGKIISNNVFVKAGPSSNSYSTLKLDKNAEVTVVGIKGEWLKIVPPEGSFSFVPQVYVTRHGDGSKGRTNSPLYVRAGSSLNEMKTAVQLKMEEGQDLTILGDKDEYYKVAPPKDAFVYVNKQYVIPVRRGPDTEKPEPTKTDKIGGGDEERIASNDGTDKPATTQGNEDIAITQNPDAKKPDGWHDQLVADNDGPTTKPAATSVAAVEDFNKLQAEFDAASKQPVIDQPIEQLIEKFSSLAKSGTLTGVNKRIVDARLVALNMRKDARAELQKFARGREETLKRQQALAEEKKELDARAKETEVSLFTAVGTLRMSSLQAGTQTLYRLTDPATGKTIVYIRSNDPKYAGLLNQFVGVRGDLTRDERMKMKIITPTGAEPVDAAKVNGTVIATLTPPSMLSAAATVDTRETGN